MLRQILLMFMIIGTAGTVRAQFSLDYSLLCDETQKLITSLELNHKETLTWSGAHSNDLSVYSLWTNSKTGAWTLLKMTPSISCVLGTGQQSVIRLGDPV